MDDDLRKIWRALKASDGTDLVAVRRLAFELVRRGAEAPPGAELKGIAIYKVEMEQTLPPWPEWYPVFGVKADALEAAKNYILEVMRSGHSVRSESDDEAEKIKRLFARGSEKNMELALALWNEWGEDQDEEEFWVYVRKSKIR